MAFFASVGRWRPFLVNGCVVAGLWGGLFCLGYPFPHPDDLAYTGAGLNLAAGHGLINPLIEPEAPFYIYPPMYSYLVAAWLGIFGTTSMTVCLFALFLAAGATWFVTNTFQIIQRPILGWVSIVALMTYFCSMGLRPDIGSFFFLGLSLWMGVSKPGWFRFLSPLCAMLAVATLPAAMTIALPWLGYLLFPKRDLWVAFLLGLVVTVLLAVLFVGGHVCDFWKVFSSTITSSRGLHLRWAVGILFHPRGLIELVSFPLLGVVLVGLAVRRRHWRWGDFLSLSAIMLGLYSTISSVSGQRILDLVALMVIGFYLLEIPWPPRLTRWLTIAVGLTYFVTFGRPLVQGITVAKPKDLSALRNEVDSLHPSRLIVDQWAMRYVFDYQIRKGMVLIGYSMRPHGHSDSKIIKYPDECWVISAETTNYYLLHEPDAPIPQPMKLCGHPIGSWIVNAGVVAVLPSKQ